MESERQYVFFGPLDSFKFSGHSQQLHSLDGIDSLSDIQLFSPGDVV